MIFSICTISLAIGMPRGEILIAGNTVTQGYLIDDENPDEEMKKKNELF